MSRSPKYKIINPQGEYVASCKYAEDAAMIVAAYGDGAKVRYDSTNGRVVWHEGHETTFAADSYDEVANVIHTRIREALAQ